MPFVEDLFGVLKVLHCKRFLSLHEVKLLIRSGEWMELPTI